MTQFLNNNITETVKRHDISYDPIMDILSFTYNDKTYNEKIADPNSVGNNINITSRDIQEADENKLKEYKTKIRLLSE